MLDQLVRYEPVVEAVAACGEGTLLDVGSGSVGIAPWLSRRWTVTAVDRSFSDYGSASGPADDGRAERIEGDVLDLPFDDGAFDVAVALDLFEHLAPADRPRAAAELARVARRRLLVGCPTGRAALEGDRRLAARFAEGEVPEWLAEHLVNGFPEPEELARLLAAHGVTTLIANESVSSHARLMRAEFTRAGSIASRALTRALRPLLRDGAPARGATAAAVRALLSGRHRPPAYRTIAVVDLSP